MTTTISGRILDEFGTPVVGALVSAHGRELRTGELGTYVIDGVEVPRDRVLVKVRADGFFHGARAVTPTGSQTHLDVHLMEDTQAGTVASNVGGTVEQDGASVELPANAFVADGVVYDGEVRIALRHLDPTASRFGRYFSGDLSAVRADDSATTLRSYGVLRVELQGTAGSMVQLDGASPATLRFPVPEALLAGAPLEMPLWFFDEDQGTWVEEGTATLQGNEYVGEVLHFTDWNADVPSEAAYVEGRVACSGRPIGFAEVQVGQGAAVAGADGRFRQRVPAGVQMEVSARSPDGATSSAISVPALDPQAVYDVGDLEISRCPAVISGRLACNGTGGAGTVVATWTGGSASTYTADGDWTLTVPPNTPVQLRVRSPTISLDVPDQVGPVAESETLEVGELSVCGAAASFCEMTLPAAGWEIVVANGGERAAVALQDQDVVIVEPCTQSVVHTLPFPFANAERLEATADLGRVMVHQRQEELRVFDGMTGALLRTVSPVGTDATLLPDGARVITENDAFQLQLIDVGSGDVVRTFSDRSGISASRLLGTTAGGAQYVSVEPTSLDEPLTADWRVVSWSVADDAQVSSTTLPLGFTDATWSSISPDGTLISWQLLGGTEERVSFRDTATGAERGNVLDPGRLAIAPDNASYLAIFEDDQQETRLGILSVTTGEPLQQLPFDFQHDVVDFAFSPDGRSVGVVYWDRISSAWVRVYQLQ